MDFPDLDSSLLSLKFERCVVEVVIRFGVEKGLK